MSDEPLHDMHVALVARMVDSLGLSAGDVHDVASAMMDDVVVPALREAQRGRLIFPLDDDEPHREGLRPYRVVSVVTMEVDAHNLHDAGSIAQYAAGFPGNWRPPAEVIEVQGEVNGKRVTGRLLRSQEVSVSALDDDGYPFDPVTEEPKP